MSVFKRKQKAVAVSSFKMIEDRHNGFFSWDGNLYKSDVIRAAIRPKVRAIGKTVVKHLRKTDEKTEVNPELYMRFLLEEPNPHMSMQQLLERTVTQLELNNNAFIFIERERALPVALYPIKASAAEILRDQQGYLYYRFQLIGGKTVIFKHEDVVHISKDFNEDPYFGESNAGPLTNSMEIINTMDQGIVKAIKNSNVIKWLLKINQTLHQEDIEKATKSFIDSFLSTDSESVGAAAVDSKMDAKQVEPKDYMPSEKQMDEPHKRIYRYFNTNEKIIMSTYTEDEWIAYYEAAIEPDVVQISHAFTRKLLTRKQRAQGEKIILESNNLSFASMTTKMQLIDLVDRGIMSPNEMREILNYAPTKHGDEFVRRLDTDTVNKSDRRNRKGGDNK